jgi:hypothetical protein
VSAVPPSHVVVVGPVHTKRCARHSSREAAARCPSCGDFFCRECIVEHEGRLLCTSCLAREAARAGKHADRWVRTRRRLALAAAMLVAGLVFYAMGSMLLSVPPDFHEGNIWTPKNGRSR